MRTRASPCAVPPWGQWLTWSGAVRRREYTLQAFDLARRVCREAAGTAKVRAKLSTAATVAAVERLARSDRRHARCAGNRHLDRLTAAPIEESGFRIEALRTGYAAGPKPMVFMYEDVARHA